MAVVFEGEGAAAVGCAPVAHGSRPIPGLLCSKKNHLGRKKTV